jgi:hypothetical protein
MTELAKMSDMRQTVLYKLRLNKLDDDSRTLQKANVIDTMGFLTIEGCQVFMDALWQSNPDIQHSIAVELRKLKKDSKKDEDKE